MMCTHAWLGLASEAVRLCSLGYAVKAAKTVLASHLNKKSNSERKRKKAYSFLLKMVRKRSRIGQYFTYEIKRNILLTEVTVVLACSDRGNFANVYF